MTRAEQFCGPASAVEVTLRLLATSDLHMSILPYDYHADGPPRPPGAVPGLAGVAAAVSQLRAAPGTSLLFDCGDFLQGGPMADYLALHQGLAPGEPHPMIAAMNLLGYDAVTLGNHDFSYGLGFLETALRAAQFPVVSANLLRRDGGVFRPAHAVLNVTLVAGLPPLRVGVIGFAPPQLVQWEAAQLRGRLASTGMVAAAQAHLPDLRAQGVDLVVALVHGGLARPGARAMAEHAALPLASVPGIDVLLLGHAHEVFPGPHFAGLPGVDAQAGCIKGRPAVMPGMNGSHLGVVELRLRHGAEGWQHSCVAVTAQPLAGMATALRARPPPSPRAAAPAPPTHGRDAAPPLRSTARAPQGDGLAGAGRAPSDAAQRRRTAAQLRRLGRLVAPVHAATRAHVARPVGMTSVRIHTHFARIADGAALRLVGAAHHAWARAAVAETADAGLPILAAVAPFRAGGRGGPGHFTDIPPGPLRLRHLHDLYPFPNGLWILRLTGAQVAEWLERTAAFYARLAPGARDAALLPAEVPAYAVDMLWGASYAFDLSAPARFTASGRLRSGVAGRVRGLQVGGQGLAPDAPCLLVTSSYRAAGGGGFPGTGPGAAALPQRGDARAALLEHLRAGAQVPPDGPPLWHLTAPPGTTALYDTAPEAAAHLNEIAALRPEVLGLTPAGFLRLRLRF